VKGTALLTVDHPEPDRDDDQWLYLPALRRVRRIAASDRGESFLGTDLSYEDVKKETKVGLEDYTWRTLGEGEVEGHRCLEVEAVPVDERRAAELGYGRVVSWVDAEIWMVRRAEYYDRAGRPLKSARVSEIREVDGVWTPHRIEVESRRSGHRTIFTVSDVSYTAAVPEEVFTEAALRRGGP
jgi:outer membrane lipoprotein-sorting protein